MSTAVTYREKKLDATQRKTYIIVRIALHVTGVKQSVKYHDCHLILRADIGIVKPGMFEMFISLFKPPLIGESV